MEIDKINLVLAIALILIVIAIFLIGASAQELLINSPNITAGSCSVDSNCSKGYYCVSGICAKEVNFEISSSSCTKNRDCQLRYGIDSSCVNTICIIPMGKPSRQIIMPEDRVLREPSEIHPFERITEEWN
ncbi:MAG: hypothetical protein ABH821_00495 [archaeon]